MLQAQQRVWPILLAAGSGQRMQMAGLPAKQHRLLAGKSVMDWSIELLLATLPHDLWVMISADQLPIQNVRARVHYAIGGATRFDSLCGALALIKAAGLDVAEDFILVHDAARPALHSEDLGRLLSQGLLSSSGALLAEPVRDTLKYVTEGQVQKTMARSQLWQAQTPQLFPAAVLIPAVTEAQAHSFVPTDESELVEHLGLFPRIIAAQHPNLKLTYPGDWLLLEGLLRQS